jgi:hypothetical protein
MAKKTNRVKTEIQFTAGRVRRLLEHARKCKEYLPLQEDDQTAYGPGIVLVTEFTIYLASNGKDDTPIGEDSDRIVFAEGLDPAKWDDDFELNQRKVELVGGRNDSVFLKGDDVELVLGRADDWDLFRITVFHDGTAMKQVLMMPPATRAESIRWAEAV